MIRILPKVGALGTAAAVILFALFLLFRFPPGAFIACSFLPLGWILTAAGFHLTCRGIRHFASGAGLLFAAVYLTMVLMLYGTRHITEWVDLLNTLTSVSPDDAYAEQLYFYMRNGFNCFALSVFCTGLSISPRDIPDRALQWLLLIYGGGVLLFAILPFSGVFAKMAELGTPALIGWCVYFAIIAVLAYRHFDIEDET